MTWAVTTQAVAIGALAVVLMAVLWGVQIARRDAGIVDVGWAAGLGLAALLLAVVGKGHFERRIAVGLLAGLWAARLGGYLFWNRIWRRTEDGRYQTLRARWQPHANRYFFLFFEFQAILVVTFSVPLVVVANHDVPLGRLVDCFALALWCVSMAGESLADHQLARHRANPINRGRTCRQGLWRYSRHPNYFFEWLHWWVYVLLAVGSRWWWVSMLGPALMLWFLCRLTGIPATERQAVATRGDDYRQYQRTTSALIPWFPRRDPQAAGPDSDTR